MKAIAVAFAATLLLGLAAPAHAVERANTNGALVSVETEGLNVAVDEVSARKGRGGRHGHGHRGFKRHGHHGWRGHRGWKRHGWHGRRWHGYRYWGGRRYWGSRYWGSNCWRVWYLGRRVWVCR